MRYMNKAAKLCIVLAAIICLFSITAYDQHLTKEETLNSSDEYLPPTTNISDSYLNSSADKKENNIYTSSPIHTLQPAILMTTTTHMMMPYVMITTTMMHTMMTGTETAGNIMTNNLI